MYEANEITDLEPIQPSGAVVAEKEVYRADAACVAMENAVLEQWMRFGVALNEMKATLPHGEFVAWLENAGLSKTPRQCQKYMKLAASNTNPGSYLAKTDDLNVALKLLVLEESDPTAHDAVMEQLKGENTITRNRLAEVQRELEDKEVLNKQISAEAVAKGGECRRLHTALKAAENKPAQVVYETNDTAAIEQALQENKVKTEALETTVKVQREQLREAQQAEHAARAAIADAKRNATRNGKEMYNAEVTRNQAKMNQMQTAEISKRALLAGIERDINGLNDQRNLLKSQLAGRAAIAAIDQALEIAIHTAVDHLADDEVEPGEEFVSGCKDLFERRAAEIQEFVFDVIGGLQSNAQF